VKSFSPPHNNDGADSVDASYAQMTLMPIIIRWMAIWWG